MRSALATLCVALSMGCAGGGNGQPAEPKRALLVPLAPQVYSLGQQEHAGQGAALKVRDVTNVREP